MQDLSLLQRRFGARYPQYLLGVLMLGSMAMILASTSINVALPAIMADFHIGRPLAQWLSTGFLAAMTAGLLLSAWAQARLGARATAQAEQLLARKDELGGAWLGWVAGELYRLNPAPYAAMVRRELERLSQDPG